MNRRVREIAGENLGVTGVVFVCLCGPQCRRRVFHRLLYVILMMRKERAKPCLLTPTQAVCNARDQAVLFVRSGDDSKVSMKCYNIV